MKKSALTVENATIVGFSSDFVLKTAWTRGQKKIGEKKKKVIDTHQKNRGDKQ